MGLRTPLIIKGHFTSSGCADVAPRDVGRWETGPGQVDVALGVQVTRRPGVPGTGFMRKAMTCDNAPLWRFDPIMSTVFSSALAQVFLQSFVLGMETSTILTY